MNSKLKLTAVALGATAVMTLTACGVDNDRDRSQCQTSTQYVPMYFFGGVYYYDAGHHKRVPDYKLPKSAKKVPGFKSDPKTAKPPVNKAPKGSTGNGSGSKPNMQKPAPAPKAPAAPAPAPRVGGRR